MLSRTDKRWWAASLAAALAGAWLVQPATLLAQAGPRGERARFSLSESRPGPDGVPRFTLVADRADARVVLHELLTRAGQPHEIAADVAGTVQVRIRDATLDELLRRLPENADPPIRIQREGGVVRVTRNYAAERAAAEIRSRLRTGALRAQPRPGPIPGGYLAAPLIPVDRLVTLEVDRSRPVALSEVLARITAQTGYVVRLDRRAPRDLTFSGSIVRTPLPLVLQTIAETCGLRLTVRGQEAILVPAPLPSAPRRRP